MSVGLSSRFQKQGFKNAPISYYADGNDEKTTMVIFIFWKYTMQ